MFVPAPHHVEIKKFGARRAEEDLCFNILFSRGTWKYLKELFSTFNNSSNSMHQIVRLRVILLTVPPAQ